MYFHRRARKPNYSHEETMVLLEQIETHRHILFGKSSNHQRSELWSFIADAVNSVPNSSGRTVEELKHRWKDMSHKSRNSLRSLSTPNSCSNKKYNPPSIYHDIIMRILDDSSDRSEFNNVQAYEGHSSSPKCADDGQKLFADSEVDIKPDINIINNFINSASKTNSIAMNSNTNSPQNMDEKDVITSNNLKKNICDTSYHMHGIEDSLIHNLPENFSSSNQKDKVGDMEKQTYTLRGRKSCNSRPMRFDPITKEVEEVDDAGLHSDTSDDVSLCSKLTEQIADEEMLPGRGHVQENAEKSALNLCGHSFKKKRTGLNSLKMSSLSIEELQKLYLIKKIEMINHRTRCFQLMEQKFQSEIKLLQQQSVISSNQQTYINNSHNSRVCNLRGSRNNSNESGEEM